MDQTSFTALYEQFAPDVLRFARYLTGRADWADEILAETFFRAWATRSSLRMGTAKGYLIAIARNLAHDRFRSQRFDAEMDTSFAAPDAKPDARLLLDQTMQAMQRLPERYREPLMLYAVAELPYEEIARCLDLPLGTVKVRVHRARLALYDLIHAAPGRDIQGDCA